MKVYRRKSELVEAVKIELSSLTLIENLTGEKVYINSNEKKYKLQESGLQLILGHYIVIGEGILNIYSEDEFTIKYESLDIDDELDYMNLPPHMKRVAIEEYDLKDKVDKLDKFISKSDIFTKLSTYEKRYRIIQHFHMGIYLKALSNILRKRK